MRAFLVGDLVLDVFFRHILFCRYWVDGSGVVLGWIRWIVDDLAWRGIAGAGR